MIDLTYGKNYVRIIVLYLKSSLAVFPGGGYVKRSVVRILFIVFVAALLAWEFIPGPRKSTLNASTLGVDEVTPLALELVYEGDKPEGIGSVQGFAITDDFFVIAGRPRGSAAEGGETNNKLIVIDRADLMNVTGDYFALDETMELGHANGMAYNPNSNELLVAGIRDDDGSYHYAARVDATDFRLLETVELPCYTNNVAFDNETNSYYTRSSMNLYRMDAMLNAATDEQYVNVMFTGQDIGFYHDRAYLIHWVSLDDRKYAWKVGLDYNQNIIYQFDTNTEALRAFIVTEPYQEMESIDFADGKAYVLMNGTGLANNRYYIYEALFDRDDIE